MTIKIMPQIYINFAISLLFMARMIWRYSNRITCSKFLPLFTYLVVVNIQHWMLIIGHRVSWTPITIRFANVLSPGARGCKLTGIVLASCGCLILVYHASISFLVVSAGEIFLSLGGAGFKVGRLTANEHVEIAFLLYGPIPGLRDGAIADKWIPHEIDRE